MLTVLRTVTWVWRNVSNRLRKTVTVFNINKKIYIYFPWLVFYIDFWRIMWQYIYIYIYIYMHTALCCNIYSSQHLTFEVDQKSSSKLSWQEHILVLDFRTTLMKGFDPLQMLTTVFKKKVIIFHNSTILLYFWSSKSCSLGLPKTHKHLKKILQTPNLWTLPSQEAWRLKFGCIHLKASL